MARPSREETAQRNAAREETGRSTRVPLGVPRSKMSVKDRPGYRRRWINDVEGRLAYAEEGSYTYVTDQSLQIGSPDIDNENRDLGARVSRVVDKATGQKAYLMEIKEELYQADQVEKRKVVKAKDDLIKHGKLVDDEDRYVPDKGRGISIETR